MAMWEGAVRQHGVADGVRYRHGQWLADGKTLVAVSDETGEERLVVVRDGATRDDAVGYRPRAGDARRARRASGRVTNHRNEVLLGDLATKKIAVIDHSECGRSEDLAWSPDGAWLAYSFWTDPRHCAIKLHDVAKRKSTLVTQPEFRDYCPAFDPAGKYLYFLSVRTFDPVYDNVQFELSFPRAARPYLIALQSDQRPPFDPEPKGMKARRPQEGRQGRREARAVRVDLDGIARRVAAFPVPEGRFGQIAGVPAARSCGR